MMAIASEITSLTIVYSTVYWDTDQKIIKAPRHWPLCGEFTGTGEFPAQRASYAEKFSIWWRHHGSHKSDNITTAKHNTTQSCACLVHILYIPWWICGGVQRRSHLCCGWCELQGNKYISHLFFQYQCPIHTVETLYNTINFCWNTHKRHSIARPKGRGMECLLWVQRTTYCVDLSIWSSIKYLL